MSFASVRSLAAHPPPDAGGPGGGADERLRQEADHRIANSLQLVSLMLRRDRARVEDAAGAFFALDGALVRVQAIADLHRRICHLPEAGAVDLADFLRPLCDGVEDSIGVRMDVRWGGRAGAAPSIEPDAAARVAIVIVELATNAAKYSGREDGRACLLVEVDGLADGALRIAVRDDGPGLPDGHLIAETGGIGASIMEAALAGAGGTLRALPPDGAGAGFEIDLPPSRQAAANGRDGGAMPG